MQSAKTLYRFLSLTQGVWQNAVYVGCAHCPYSGTGCGGHLLTTDAEGAPFLFPVSQLEALTGEKVDKFECAAVITKEVFEKLFYRWLVWNVTDPDACSILQVISKAQSA